MKTNRLIISLTVAGVLAIGAISASAVQSTYTAQGVYGCISPVGKNISYLRPTEHNCPSGWNPISWASEGPVGAPGPQGSQGPKGDPGYSYDEALASVDDPNSSVQSVSFGSGGCVGPDFKLYSAYGNRFICAKTFRGISTVNVLSAKAAPMNGENPEARAIYIAPGECPNSWNSFDPIMITQNVKGFLVEDASPFKLSNTSEVSCLFMYINSGYQSQSGMYQVVYSTN